MQTIKVSVEWEDKNFACGWSLPGFGAIICTDKNLDSLKKEFADSLTEQANDMLADGECVPQWIADGEYTIEFELSAAALLRQAEQFTTLSAISRASGINCKLLSHYANALKKPRPAQRERIVKGLAEIAGQIHAIL